MYHLEVDQFQGALFSVDFLPGRAAFDTELNFFKHPSSQYSIVKSSLLLFHLISDHRFLLRSISVTILKMKKKGEVIPQTHFYPQIRRVPCTCSCRSVCNPNKENKGICFLICRYTSQKKQHLNHLSFFLQNSSELICD